MHSNLIVFNRIFLCSLFISSIALIGCNSSEVAGQMEVHRLVYRSSLPFSEEDMAILEHDGNVTPMLAVAIYRYCVMNPEESSSCYISRITSDSSVYYLHVNNYNNNEKVILRLRIKDGYVYDSISGFWTRQGYVNLTKTKLQAMFEVGTDIKDVYKSIGEPAKIEWCEMNMKHGVNEGITLLSYLTRSGWSALAFKNNKLIQASGLNTDITLKEP